MLLVHESADCKALFCLKKPVTQSDIELKIVEEIEVLKDFYGCEVLSLISAIFKLFRDNLHKLKLFGAQKNEGNINRSCTAWVENSVK